jgi:hypothetical protein
MKMREDALDRKFLCELQRGHLDDLCSTKLELSIVFENFNIPDKYIDGIAIAQRTNMQMVNVIIIKNATSLNVFGTGTIVTMYNLFLPIILINALVIIKV